MRNNLRNKQEAVFFFSGYDPSGNAGLIKDITSAKATHTVFYAIPTALTLQTRTMLEDVIWINLDLIISHLMVGLKEYVPSAVKIGIIKSFSWISFILEEMQKFIKGKIYVVIDPIVKSSTGFVFHSGGTSLMNITTNEDYFESVVTPNTEEAIFFGGGEDPVSSARIMSRKFKVILKGGHDQGPFVVDRLFINGKCEKEVTHQRLNIDTIRGKGCLYASLLACYLARGVDLSTAMEKASFLLYKIFSKQISG